MFLEKLRGCEDELVSLLSGVDTQELCDKFFERCLLSSESHAHFTSLDHSRLKPQLQVRYLVRLASERVKTDPALGHNLIEVLDTLKGVPSSLTDKLKQAMADTNERPTDDSDTVGGLSATAVGGAIEEKDIVLTQDDISLLTKLLTKVSHKWLEIAISLGLQENEQADCKGETNTISLSQSIGFWIANSSKPTLKKLTNNLSSATVGRKNISKEVEERFLTARSTSCSQNNNPSASESKSSTKSSQTPRMVSQSLPTEVTDGKSTLLQVQARPRESVVSYQWNKDGQPLANSSRYSGVDEDILVVRQASQGTEGEYTCCVSLQDRQVTSNSITLTVHFPPAKNHLLNKYSNLNKVPNSRTEWPPEVSNSFINLALVKSSSKRKNKSDLSVCGDADDVIAEKEKIEYDEVFGEYKSNELILVEGRPGSGKTTLVHKVIKDWASGKALAKSKLTLLLTLRLLNDGQDGTLEKVLQTLYSDEDAIAILPDIRDGEGVCFVLDGLDEYQPRNRENSVLLKLLNRKCFPKCMIVVFTRPSASEQLNKDLIKKTIEVFGFKKKQISEYIDNFPFDKEGGTIDTRASQLKGYLLSHPNIHDMCYLPIHAAMICFLFQFAKNISATQTKVYEEFTRSIIHRHLARHENCKALTSLKDLDGEYEMYFKDLCHFAYEMTIKSKQVISENEVQVQFGGSGSLSEERGLGLLTICPTLCQSGIHQSYAFLHLTFQEFLAAYYIANYMEVSQQLNILKKYSDLKTVWLFYSGLADLEETPEILDKLFSHDVMELCRYALESQKKTLSDKILKDESSRLKFYGAKTPTDLLSIEYVIATSSLPITEIQIECYHDNHNRMGALLQQLQKANVQQLDDLDIGDICDEETNSLCEVLQTATNITSLHIMIKHTRSCCANELALQINQCTNLSHLRLSYSGTPECIQTFFSSLSPSVSWWVSLSLEKLDSQSIQAFGNGLQHLHTSHLKLKVTESDINEDGITCLVDGLQNIKLVHLNLSDNNIDSSGMIPFDERLKTLKLRDLDLSYNNIGLDGATVLAGGIKCLTELKELDLSHNNIGPDGATALADGINGLTELNKIYLSHNNIGPDGATALANGIKGLTELNQLDLSHNNIGPDGATALAGGIKGLTELEELDLSHNNIGPDGATALAGGLQCLTKLVIFDLSHNNIDVAAAKVVLTSLKKCDHLFQLTINESEYDWTSADIMIRGLLSPDDTATMSELEEAAQHGSKTRTLKLGFKTITVLPRRAKKWKCVVM